MTETLKSLNFFDKNSLHLIRALFPNIFRLL